MFRALFGLIGMAVLAITGLFAFLIASTLWGQGEAAKWAAFFLGLTTATLIFVAFMALDWVNDAQASRAARQFQENSLRDLQDSFRTQQMQNRALQAGLQAMMRLPGSEKQTVIDAPDDIFTNMSDF